MKRFQHIHRRVVVWQSSIYQTTTTLIDAGDAVILIDPNWLPDEIAEIQQWICTHHRNKEIFLVITHSDFDHIIGCGAFPEATIIASVGVQQHPEKQKKLDEIAAFDAQNYILRPYSVSYPTIDVMIREDRFSMTIGQLEVLFFLSPGHVSDSIFCLIPEFRQEISGFCGGIWIAGDYLSDAEIPWIDDDLTAYLDTIEKSLTIFNSFPDVCTLVPGHGNPATDRVEIYQRIMRDRTYLQFLKDITDFQSETMHWAEIKNLLNTYEFSSQMNKIHLHNLQKVGAPPSMIREILFSSSLD